jgi:tetratricopeptide (TPR) repeat protein
MKRGAMTHFDPRRTRTERFLAAAKTAIEARNWQEADDLAAALLANDGPSAEALFVQALVAFLGDDLAAAAGFGNRALEMNPDVRECVDLMAVVYGRAGDVDTAIYFAKLATAVPSVPALLTLIPAEVPSFAEVFEAISERPLLQCAAVAMANANWSEAERWAGQHLAFEPTCREAHLGLAVSRLVQGVARAAVEGLRAARHLLPDDAGIASLLGKALARIGERDQAYACHRDAERLAPEDPTIHAASLVERLPDADTNSRTLVAGFRAWGNRFGLRIDAPSPVLPAPKGDNMLTVGYLVAGRGTAPDGRAIAQILGKRNSGRFRSVGFGHGSQSKPANIPFQKCFDGWHDISATDPLTLRAMVIAEGVDILVDLAGFSAPELLVACGARMAPCQVAWLDSPCGTGLAAMDFLLTDGFVDPDASGGGRVVEELAYLDLGCVVVGRPSSRDRRSSRSDRNELVFAADASLAEIDPPTAAVWAEVLQKVPEAVLVLRDHDFLVPANLDRLTGLFGNFGVANHIDVIAEPTAGAFYAHADVGLMPLGFPRLQSLVDALAVGLPVICAAGEDRHTRLAASVLHHLGLAERMVGETAAAYVSLAVDWAARAAERAHLAETLPAHLDQAPLFDPERRICDLEAAYETMWRKTRERSHRTKPAVAVGSA